MDPHSAGLPEDPCARLYALVGVVESTLRLVRLKLRCVEQVRLLHYEDLHQELLGLLAADELVDAAAGGSVAGTDTLEELSERLSRTELAALRPGGADDPTPPVAAFVEPLVRMRSIVDEWAQQLQARLGTHDDLASELCVAAAPDAASSVVAMDLERAGFLELRCLVAGWADHAVDWRTGTGVALLPDYLASELAGRNRVRVLGPDRSVRFDPIPLTVRIADHLGQGVDLDDVYDAAVLSGSTCPAAREAAARHMAANGGMGPDLDADA